MMKSPFRFVIYLLIGMGLYYYIQSGESEVTHEQARTALIVLIVTVFILLLIVKVIKQRHEK